MEEVVVGAKREGEDWGLEGSGICVFLVDFDGWAQGGGGGMAR